jgi:hypothetical protein
MAAFVNPSTFEFEARPYAPMKPAEAEALDALRIGAARSHRRMRKSRARLFIYQPCRMGVIPAAMPEASPKKLIALALHVIERELATPRHFFGFDGEIPLRNAEGALLAGRALRRLEAKRRAVA